MDLTTADDTSRVPRSVPPPSRSLRHTHTHTHTHTYTVHIAGDARARA